MRYALKLRTTSDPEDQKLPPPPRTQLPSNFFSFCPFAFQRLKVNCEGGVSMCCFQQRGCLGNVLEESPWDIWRKQLTRSIRLQIYKCKLPEQCKIPSCPFYHVDNLSKIPQRVCRNLAGPAHLEIDLPNFHCNMGGMYPSPSSPACLMCERNRPEYTPQVDRLEDVCKALAVLVPNINTLHIQGVAEPFWKDKIFEVLEWLGVKEHKGRITVTSTTNGILIDADVRKKFFTYPRSVLTFSIDAGTPEIYRAIRRHDLFDQVLNNVFVYGKQRRLGQSLHIHSTINLININDVEKIVEIAKKARVNLLQFNATYDVPEICVNESNAELFRQAQYRILDKARQLSVKVGFMRNLCLDYLPVEHPLAVPPGCC